MASRAPLSRERIVAAAAELLDAEGVDGLSMRRLADRLGVGAMSLYWHVAGKEVVLDLALDAVLAYRPPAEAETPTDWRDEVVRMLEDWRAAMLRHPWSAPLLPRRTLGPSVLGRLEMLGAALSRAGVPDGDLNATIWAFWNHVMGATVTRASFERADIAVTPEDGTQDGPRYPTIERSGLLRDDDWDGAFRKGLDLLLDSIAPVA